MDTYYFLWLQKIANKNLKFNINLYNCIIKYFKSIEEVYNLSLNKYQFVQKIESLEICAEVDKCIIDLICDNDIKNDTHIFYEKLKKEKLYVITYIDKKYPSKLRLAQNPPFIIVMTKYINLCLNNMYIYYNDYFSKYAKNLISYFSYMIILENCNVICSYNTKTQGVIDIKYEDIFKSDLIYDKDYIILPNKNYYISFILSVINQIIIVEAQYEEIIVNLVDLALQSDVDIYVIPSNIFNKNSYFSNYLIKQGADIILSKNDIKYIARRIK